MDRTNEKASFVEYDIFNRKPVGEGIVKLIDEQKDNQGALTISIDAPWGIGKTTFIYMLINYLHENKTDWRTVYYDAWKNDMTDDPFTSLLFQICGECGNKASSDDEKKAINTFAVNSYTAVANIMEMIPTPLTKATGKLMQIGQKFMGDKEDNTITGQYIKFKDHQKKLQDNLTNLVKKCNKIIVFVDELDRCKPTFSVRALETIKHYFDIDNLVFVFAIDGIQLRETIKNYYGEGFDSSSYLTRFFEYQLLLPQPTLKQTLEYCKDIAELPSETYEFLNMVFQHITITPREVRSIIKGVDVIVNYCLMEDDKERTSLYYPTVAIAGLLLSLKCKKMQDYESIVHGKYKAPASSNDLENGMVELSNICKNNVRFLHDQAYTAKVGFLLEQHKIINALKKMLANYSEDMNIGDCLIRLINLVEIKPIEMNDE